MEESKHPILNNKIRKQWMAESDLYYVTNPAEFFNKSMRYPLEYTSTEKVWLTALGIFGFVVVNGTIFYGMLFQPNRCKPR